MNERWSSALPPSCRARVGTGVNCSGTIAEFGAQSAGCRIVVWRRASALGGKRTFDLAPLMNAVHPEKTWEGLGAVPRRLVLRRLRWVRVVCDFRTLDGL